MDKPRVMNDSPEWRLANYVPDAICPKCGYHTQYESRFYPCLCQRYQHLAFMVGIPMARAIFEAPFPQLSSIFDPLKYYRLHVEDNALYSILKHIYFKGKVHTFRIITDQQIVSIWLDKGGEEENLVEGESRQSLYSSLRPFALVIIQLGVMKSPNSAAADVLTDAINIRRCEHLPIWVWDKPSVPYGENSTCWGSNVLDIIQEFESISFDSVPIKLVPSDNRILASDVNRNILAPLSNQISDVNRNIKAPSSNQVSALDPNRNIKAPPEKNALSEYGSGLDKSKNKRRSGPGKGQFSKEVDFISEKIEDEI